MTGTRTLSLQVAGNTACRQSILPNTSSRLRRSKIPTRHGTTSSGPSSEVPGGEATVLARVAGPDCGLSRTSTIDGEEALDHARPLNQSLMKRSRFGAYDDRR